MLTATSSWKSRASSATSFGFDYLSSATAVDYLGQGDHMEMVYHAYRSGGGGALVFKAQTDREASADPVARFSVARRGFPGAGSLGFVWHPLPGASKSIADSDVGRL